jgi:hypothetical protein
MRVRTSLKPFPDPTHPRYFVTEQGSGMRFVQRPLPPMDSYESGDA